MISIIITLNESSMRLDRLLRKKLPLLSLSRIYSLVRKGGVLVNGARVKKQDYRTCEGDLIEIDADPSELAVPKEQRPAGAGTDLGRLANTEYFKQRFHVLYEDSDLLACNKPAGLVVHPGTGHLQNDTLIDLATAYLLSGKKIKSSEDISLVHRLDRDTSGVILIAKNKPAVRRLQESFRERELVKEYVALCHGRPPKDKGEIFLRLARGRDDRGETTMRVDQNGIPSRSTYRVDAFYKGLSRVEVQLITGKTHQIRIHLAHVEAPILGDVRYGNADLDKALFSRDPKIVRRLYLHALRIEIPHPKTGRIQIIKAPLPEEFKKVIG
jgi:23S rRNA pseudouridine955/2504/2580 synthase